MARPEGEPSGGDAAAGPAPGRPIVLPEIVRRAADHARAGGSAAVADAAGKHSYEDLLRAAERVAEGLTAARKSATDGASAEAGARTSASAGGLAGARVGYLVPPSFDHVALQWGVWLAGGVAVPLCLSHPPPELAYVLEDTGAALAVSGPEHADVLRPLAAERGARFLDTRELLDAARPSSDGAAPEAGGPSPPAGGASREAPDEASEEAPGPPGAAPASDRPAMILYTSGTTGRPKGVVHTHASLASQVRTLVEAWGWRSDDRILHVLPLHHTHGIVNALLCALWAGATCEFLPAFDAEAVWGRFTGGDVTLFMAVPTIYFRLVKAWEAAPEEERKRRSEAARELRLMVSGSAALPVSVFERWEEITGHPLLERYGMTEIGMALSNPLRGERRPGTVGRPLPGVELRLVDEEGRPVTAEGESGEIEVRGPTLFREYWERPDATDAAFRDGWFRTGDEAVVEDGYYRILGRKSVDIIKSGGEKISALEIEEVLRRHPAIDECAVVGVPDPEWGERVCAAVVPLAGGSVAVPGLEELREWTKDRLAPYKAPRALLVLEELPRNAVGKVTKPDVVALFEQREEESEEEDGGGETPDAPDTDTEPGRTA